MKDMIVGFFGGIFVATLLLVPAFSSFFEEQAVKHGKAEYYLDDKFERHWRWKP